MDEINVLEILGKNLHDIRLEKNISLKELAQKVHIEMETLKNFEAGEYSGLQIHQYIEIADALCVDFKELTKNIEFTSD